MADKVAVARERVRRIHVFDSGTGALAPPEQLDNGFLRVQGRISRTGIQVYQDHDGNEHREYRPPEEVFSPEALKSFHQMPVTNTHPPELLTSEDAQQHTVGALGQDLEPDGNFVRGTLMLYDKPAIDAAKSGRSQLSCGYSCELDPTPGEFEGEHYDAIQRNIRGNHLALVDEARAGPDARIRLDRLDARSALVIASAKTCKTTTEKSMHTVKIDGLALEVTDNNASAIQNALDRTLATVRNDAEAKVKELQKKLDAKDEDTQALIASLGNIIGKQRARKDALQSKKAEKLPCPDCGGAGQKMQEDGEAKKCDFCDGEGIVNAVSEFAGAQSATPAQINGKVADPDNTSEEERMMSDDDDNMMDDEDLSDDAKEEIEKKADAFAAAHKRDAKKWADKLHRDAKSRGERHDAAITSRLKIESTVRANAEKALRPILGEETKVDGLNITELYKAAAQKLHPTLKLDSANLGALKLLVDAAKPAADKTDSVNPTDSVRGNIAMPSIPMPRAATGSDAQEKMIKRNQDAWKPVVKDLAAK